MCWLKVPSRSNVPRLGWVSGLPLCKGCFQRAELLFSEKSAHQMGAGWAEEPSLCLQSQNDFLRADTCHLDRMGSLSCNFS